MTVLLCISDDQCAFRCIGPPNSLGGSVPIIDCNRTCYDLIVDGNPLEDILLLTDPEANLSLIMKDGEIYKNELAN